MGKLARMKEKARKNKQGKGSFDNKNKPVERGWGAGGPGAGQRKPSADQLPQEVKAGEWTDVKRSDNMMPALGVRPHPDQQRYPGVLLDVADGSVVAWHNKGCTRKGLKPDSVRFDRNGAPWCPTCFAENMQRDPSWNQESVEVAPLDVPIPASVRDEHRSNGGRSFQNEMNRAAIESGRFRQPFKTQRDGDPDVLIGDDRVVAAHGGPGVNPQDMYNVASELAPPERFDG